MASDGAKGSAVAAAAADGEDDTTIPLAPSDPAFLELLSEGFAALKEHQYGPSDAQVQLESTPDFLRSAIVNFIDPTASSVAGAAAGSATAGGAAKGCLDLYERLVLILRSEHGATLRKVPYANPRSGVTGVIPSLALRTYMTGGQGGLISLSEDRDDVPWAGTGSATGLGPDPADWHRGPLCHVYLAACGSVEQYRTQVKPSIQAFLSQIDAVARYTVGGKDAPDAATAGRSQYVIVFVPTGEGARAGASGAAEDGTQRGAAAGPGGGKLGIWASARQRMAAREAEKAAAAAVEAREASMGSGAGAASNPNNDSLDMEELTSGQQTLVSYLSRTDREIMRRLSNDFSAGVVCQLSTLADTPEDDVYMELKAMEWNAFLKGLGTAIVSGFRERCKKYDEELRKLDQMRGTFNKDNPTVDRFDYSTFFLVKESLAFTYQQMNLSTDASLQYDELQAVIPEMKPSTKTKPAGALFAFSANGDSSSSLLSHGSMSIDPTTFRKRLRSVKDLQPLAQIIQQYIFSRQTELSFKINKPMEVVDRCLAFAQTMYKFKREHARTSSSKKEMIQAESWAFNFCWDVKKACESFYADGTESMSFLDYESPKVISQADRALACSLCNLLDFARLRLLNLGDLVLPENPIRSQINILTLGSTEDWSPWRPMKKDTGTNDASDDEGDASESLMPSDKAQIREILKRSLGSTESFLEGYMDLLKVIAETNRSAERHRCSARLAIDIAGIHVYRKDLVNAILALRAASNAYARDRWETTNFLILLRLASYQRKMSTADEYIDTLVKCFNPAMKISAPSKALDVLHQDLEAVLRSSLVSRARFPSTPIFRPVLGLDGVKPTHKTLSSRDIVKKVYTVGERARVNLTLHSFLPRDIVLQEIAVDLVPFREYVSAIEESKSGGYALDLDKDTIKVLRLFGSLNVSPNENEFVLEWYPRVTGQFVLATISLKWHNIRFSYTAKELKQATIRVDVLPAAPTQSITVTPSHLLPGHEQPITIAFSAGDDVVEEGSIKFACSPGLQLLPPEGHKDSENWCATCETKLKACQPGETIEIVTSVKFIDVEDSSAVMEETENTLKVTLSTTFRPPESKESLSIPKDSDHDEGFPEKHSVDIEVLTLAKPALTIERSGLSFYTQTCATANVTLQCNALTALKIKRWTVSLPSFVMLNKNGDLNDALVNSCIEPGEQVTMAFDCSLITGEADQTGNLVVEFEDIRGSAFKETFSLRFKRPSSAGINPFGGRIPVSVSPSTSEATVLDPVNVTYEVDTTATGVSTGAIQYRLDSSFWIICGKCEGLIELSKQSQPVRITVVILPTRPGTVKDYPRLSLFYLNDCTPGIDAIAIPTVVAINSNDFQSTPAEKHTTVAVPVAPKQNKQKV